MPVQRGKDSDGAFFRWGASGKKYHYTEDDAESLTRAKAKAARQGRAINASRAKRGMCTKVAFETIMEAVASGVTQHAAPGAGQRFQLLDKHLQGKPLIPGFNETSLGSQARGDFAEREAEERSQTRQATKLVMKALKLGMALELDPHPTAEYPVGTAEREREEASTSRMVRDRVMNATRGETSAEPTPSKMSKLSELLAATPSPAEQKRDISEQHRSLEFDDTRIPKRGVLPRDKHGSTRLELRSTRPRGEQEVLVDKEDDVDQRHRLPDPSERGSEPREAWRKHRSYDTHSDLLEGYPSTVSRG